MRTATAKDLRRKTAEILREVRRGGEVVITHRGKSVAILVPVAKRAGEELSLTGFGMWRGRREMGNVEAWLGKVRKPRYRRSSSIPTF